MPEYSCLLIIIIIVNYARSSFAESSIEATLINVTLNSKHSYTGKNQHPPA